MLRNVAKPYLTASKVTELRRLYAELLEAINRVPTVLKLAQLATLKVWRSPVFLAADGSVTEIIAWIKEKRDAA
jgi:hypothetical protein